MQVCILMLVSPHCVSCSLNLLDATREGDDDVYS